MAGSQFHSQHSEVMLNVSENHYSSSPNASPHAQTQVNRSPSIRPSQSEARVPESIERVEDSYQESFGTKAPPQLIDQNGDSDGEQDEEPYAVSPSGKAKLDATISAKKSRQQEKALPARNPIDALLDEGAVIESSGANDRAKSKDLATGKSASFSGYAALDARLKVIDVNARTAKKRRTTENADIERVKTKDGDKEPTERHKSQADLQPPKPSASTKEPANRPTKARELPETAVNAIVAEESETNDNDGEVSDVNVTEKGRRQPKGSKAAPIRHYGTASGKGPVASTSAQQTLSQSSKTKLAGGRPQRKAKQSALEKLKAKHGQADGAYSSEASEDSGDDFSNTVPQPKAVKGPSKRVAKAKQLPTPVTNGSSKRNQIGTSTDKLKSVKHQPRAATTSMEAPKASKAMSNTAASNHHHKSDRALTDDEEKHVPLAIASKPQRPGALKRPARSFSRGRNPQRDSIYDRSDDVPRTKKRGRSNSKASKASIMRPGSVREKMQSQSTKELVDTMRSNSRHPSVSVKPSPKSTRRTHQRQDDSVKNKKKVSTASDLVAKATSHAKSKVSDTTPANAEPAQQNIGSSQANAIVIEQEDGSSSIAPSSPPKEVHKPAKTTTNAKAGQSISRPQTPAPMLSSPPVPNTGSAQTLVKDKPTIIAFGKLGPRNQGIRSARKTTDSAVSSETMAEESSTERGRTGKHVAAPVVTSARELAVAAIAKGSGNVSDEDEDVFGAFTKNGRNTALANMLKQSQLGASVVDQFPEDDGFVAIDDFDDTTLVDNDAQAESATKERTASQIAMPPPKAIGRTTNRSTKIQAPLPLATTLESAISKDTPRPEQTRQADSLPVKGKGKHETVPTKKPTGKLPRDDKARPASPENDGSKKLPVDNVIGSRVASDIARNTATAGQLKRKTEAIEETAARSPKRTRNSGTSSLNVPSNTELTSTRVPLGADTAGTTTTKDDAPSKKVNKRGRPIRRSTQGSQGVDLLGSPYPKDFEVPTQTTALETFFQQTEFSSDAPLRSDAEVVSKLNLRAVPALQPPVKPGLVSSNGKSIPAAPNESSKAVTRVASGPLAQQLLNAKRSQPAMSDPFTSSREGEVTVNVTAPSTGYEQAVRQRGISIDQSVPDTKRTRRETRGKRDEDPDKTLVEPVEEPDHYVQYNSGSPVASQAASASTPGAAAKALEDVGDWRNALKPHQVHLFDSLVIAAHKLVRHMVDHETADRDIVDDYRRRGEIIVTELHRAHAREYKRYTEGMQDWKQRAADELAAHGRKLKQSMKDAEKGRSERRQAKRSANEFDNMLEELVAGLDE